MYYIYFRPEGSSRGTASLVVGDVPSLMDTVAVLERAMAQYKVFQATTYLKPEHFGLGGMRGWLSLEASFS